MLCYIRMKMFLEYSGQQIAVIACVHVFLLRHKQFYLEYTILAVQVGLHYGIFPLENTVCVDSTCIWIAVR